jgi:hypothetical protein
MNTPKKIPLRKCLGCGEMKPKNELVRILRTDEEEVVIDFTGKKNGRGAYLCSNAQCLDKAIKTKGIARSLKMAVPAQVYEQLRQSFAEQQN